MRMFPMIIERWLSCDLPLTSAGKGAAVVSAGCRTEQSGGSRGVPMTAI